MGVFAAIAAKGAPTAIRLALQASITELQKFPNSPAAVEAAKLAGDLLAGDVKDVLSEMESLATDPEAAAYLFGFVKYLVDHPATAGQTIVARLKAAVAAQIGAQVPAPASAAAAVAPGTIPATIPAA